MKDLSGRFAPMPLADRFWAKVQKSEGCWEWRGSTARGYGHVWVDGRLELAHRVSWRMAYGAVPADLKVLHHCDNPRCVRPDHLFLGTLSDNMVDAARKGRMGFQARPEIVFRGEDHPRAKLSDTAIALIHELASDGVRHVEIASRTGVSISTVGRVLAGTARRLQAVSA